MSDTKIVPLMPDAAMIAAGEAAAAERYDAEVSHVLSGGPKVEGSSVAAIYRAMVLEAPVQPVAQPGDWSFSPARSPDWNGAIRFSAQLWDENGVNIAAFLGTDEDSELAKIICERHNEDLAKARKLARDAALDDAADEIDCSCLARQDVMARLARGDRPKTAGNACTHGSECCAILALEIRALK